MEILFQEIFTPSLYCCEGAEVGQFSYDVQIFSLSSITSTCNQKWMWSFFIQNFGPHMESHSDCPNSHIICAVILEELCEV